MDRFQLLSADSALTKTLCGQLLTVLYVSYVFLGIQGEKRAPLFGGTLEPRISKSPGTVSPLQLMSGLKRGFRWRFSYEEEKIFLIVFQKPPLPVKALSPKDPPFEGALQYVISCSVIYTAVALSSS